jgi:hypothetical protein
MILIEDERKNNEYDIFIKNLSGETIMFAKTKKRGDP